MGLELEKIDELKKIAKIIRYYIIASTTKAGSGHPTSSLSAVELMATLVFGGFFKYEIDNPDFAGNDRLIFSKGHASPLLYALWAMAGAIPLESLMTLRNFDSNLEGHPTARFKYAEAATGSLGQGLSIGFGMALNSRYLDKIHYNTFVLLGDSEMSEGSQWEAMQLASFYKLDNLIGIIDVNRLGQTGQTIYGRDLESYEKKISSFGWETAVIDGHEIKDIIHAYRRIGQVKEKPLMIIAGTVKGKGVSFVEDKNGWHGKSLSETEFKQALEELGVIDSNVSSIIQKPEKTTSSKKTAPLKIGLTGKIGLPEDKVSTRKAYGIALVNIFEKFPQMVVLDSEVSNSTYAEIFKKAFPQSFFEMFVAEQNMAGAALGLSLRGKIPFISTFAAFFTRAFDQIRMSQYSGSNIKFCGSHAGVSIGPDGASQMGLEDMAMFRTLLNCVVFYPSDGISTMALVEKAAACHGNVYIRTTRMDTPILYKDNDSFDIGGSKTLKESKQDTVTVCAAGITVHEAIGAYEELRNENIYIKILDMYSIKPIDKNTIVNASKKSMAIITVEDHFAEGGLGEAVAAIGQNNCPVHIMAVKKMPKSGSAGQLLDYEDISKDAIVKKVKSIIRGKP